MKLIGSTTSPYVRKVRVVLAEKKLDYQFIEENPWDAASPPGAGNPLGKVPRLIVLETSEAIFDSRVIVEYLDTLSPVGKLIPNAGRERVEVKTWEALADGLLDAAVLVRLEKTWPGRSDTERSQAWMDRQWAKVQVALKAMSVGLKDKPFCCGGIHLTLADISVSCALAWLDFRFPQFDWRADHPNLAVLLDKMAARPSFVATVPV